MGDMTPYNVFCSYCWRDRAAVEAVAQALQSQGLRVFLDRWYLIPGRPWHYALEEILASCLSVAVFVGPQGLSDWQQRESSLALQRPEIPVIPILLPGAEPALGFLSLRTWVDLRQKLDDPTSLKILQLAIQGLPPGPELQSQVQTTLAAICPYRGLRPFREEDSPFFFGRQVCIDRLTQAVSCHTLVALVGASGSGKSSVARGGLIPRLRRREGGGPVWEAVTFLPGDRPLHSLAAAFLPLLEPEMTEVDRLVEVNKLAAYLQSGELTLRDVVLRVLAKQPGTDRLLLVVDQWEELYTLTREEEPRRRFLDEILQGAKAAPLVVVLTLRGDFFGQALSYRPLADRLQDAVINLGPMTRVELAEAIEKPANQVGLTFESGLVERLLDDVGQEPGNLPLLEFTLTNLWERRQHGKLLHQAYDDMGRVQGAVAQKAEDLYQGLNSLEQQAAARVFLELVQTGETTADTRRRASLTEVGGEIRELIKRLADARLVVTGLEEATGRETLEVAHEALIQNWTRLQGWLNADREFLLWRQRLRHGLEDWQHTGRDEGALLRGAPLAEAERWLNDRAAHLTLIEREFIQAGLNLRGREHQTRQRQQRRRILALASGLVLALLLLALAGWQWQRAEENRRVAQHQQQVALSRQLAAQARSLMDSKLDLAILLSLEAWRLENTVEAKSALYTALFKDSRLQSLLHGIDDPVLFVALSPDGRTLATASGITEYSIRLWDVDTCRPQGPPLPGGVTSWPQIAFSPDGKTLAAIGQGAEKIQIWDTETHQQLGPIPIKKPEVTRLAFSSDGTTLAAGLAKEGILLWDMKNHRLHIQPLKDLPPEFIYYVAFSPDLSKMATADDDSTVRLWDVPTGEPLGLPLRRHKGRVYPLAFNPQGTVLASKGNGDHCIILWDIKTQQPLKLFNSDAIFYSFGELNSMSFSPDGKILAAGGKDGVLLWDVAAPPVPTKLKGLGSQVKSISFSPDGKTLALGTNGVSFGNRLGNLVLSEVDVWSPLFFKPAQEPVYLKDILRQGNLMPNSDGLPLSPDGKIEVFFDNKAQVIKLIDADTREPLGSPITTQAKVNAFCFTPDSRILAAASADNTIRLWDVRSHSPLSPALMGLGSEVSSLAFSPDGTILASGSGGNSPQIFLWDVKNGCSLGPPLLGHTRQVNTLAFSPNGKIMVSGSQDQTIRMWDVASLQPLGPPLQDHESPLSGVAFSPDGQNLASIDKDGIIKLWDVASRQPLCNICREAGYLGTRIAFSTDGRSLLTWVQARWQGRPWEATRFKSLQISLDSLVPRACRLANRNLTRPEWQRYLGGLPYRPTCPNLPVPED